MRRLYFLVPDVNSASSIVDELLLARIEERRIHIAARDHHPLQEANLPANQKAALLMLEDDQLQEAVGLYRSQVGGGDGRGRDGRGGGPGRGGPFGR